MDFELGKKSGQIPAFGNWDNANELPITQYFESARQAGLLRYANNPTVANATAHHHHHRHRQYRDSSFISGSTARGGTGGGNGYANSCADLYAADFQKPPLRVVHVPNHRKAVHGGGGVNYSNGNGDDDECHRRRRGGFPQHLRGQQQRIKQVHDVVDLKHQNHHQQQQRTRRSSSSQQLLHSDQKKQFPKHSAIADVHKPPPTTTTPASADATGTTNNVKPVDEDLYKIPPELLLHHSKKKKMLGFFSKCLVPPCRA